MIIVENDFDITMENIEQFSEEASIKFDNIKALEKDDINRIIENIASSGEYGLAICMGSLNENMPLNEYIVKHVSSKGEVTRTKDRKTRERNAFKTTGLSKSKRRQIARRAVKTKRANPSIQTRALRKRKKALKRREALGL
ncbi:prohead core protein [Proteus phage vB_PmiM_Pm5461]|uniref:Prohead core protein n=1 Tax=Proteus phage vB_PmiM_Pm5461 TaxID=1636250 RepID=A0A0G2SS90_9CAUD|nr:head scaffolding protein [Proteus phage vB_PmiM_Pm5461]AKA62019.1 prohead core protein [Proteus phage vB_PmiM_Pm5461]